MSDISKKIFSIEPEPDEDPIALVPDPEVDLSKRPITALDHLDKSRLLSTAADKPLGGQRPIFELVEAIDDDLFEPQEEDDIHSASDTLTSAGLPAHKTTAEEIAEDKVPSGMSEETIASDPATEDIILSPLRQSPVEPTVSHINVTAPTDLAPVLSPSHPRPYTAPKEVAIQRIGWVGPVLTLMTGLTIAAGLYAFSLQMTSLNPVALSAMVLAVIVPMVTVFSLWATLKALSASRRETQTLAEVTDRLTRADDAVASDIASLSSTIRRELAQVDHRLAQSRSDVEALVAQIKRQSSEMTSMTQQLAERSVRIAQTVTGHRDAFTELSDEFNARLTALSGTIDQQRNALSQSGEEAARKVSDATSALDYATKLTAEHGDSLTQSASKATMSVTEAEARLASLSERMKQQAEDLESFYNRRTAQLTEVAEKFGSEKGIAETALSSQTEKLSAIDAQIEMTESRLGDLLNHTSDVQAQLSARLSDIDSTLSEADQRSRNFTADIADRVSDSVAQTRREISIMEGELRALQSRMEGAKTATLALDPEPDQSAQSHRINLTPLDTDFPPVESGGDDLSIPDMDGTDTLELTEAVFVDEALGADTQSYDADLVRRPGEDSAISRVFGRGKAEKTDKNWRWRDMLGSIEPMSSTDASTLDGSPPPIEKQSGKIERPGRGRPLQPPTAPAPQPEGSDVVARLCEVKLAPSAVVDEGTIREAEAARRQSGEVAQSEIVFQRLNSPIIHLRGVLSADLEFRLRAEGFRRSYNSYLDDISEGSQLQAELSTANGRAYLLCAAALSAS